MADISLPQDRDYYRVGYTSSVGRLYRNNLDLYEMRAMLDYLRGIDEASDIKVEHVRVEVVVTDVTELVLN